MIVNKMNNHLGPQYVAHQKEPKHITLEIQVLAWDRAKNVAGLNWLMSTLSDLKNCKHYTVIIKSTPASVVFLKIYLQIILSC